MQSLSELLIDVVLVESNPESWTGHGRTLAQLKNSERGDRYWAKKNAIATMTLLTKVYYLTATVEQRGAFKAPGHDEEADLDKEISAAEREARTILDRLVERAQASGNGEKQ
jgi:hypothetical protein